MVLFEPLLGACCWKTAGKPQDTALPRFLFVKSSWGFQRETRKLKTKHCFVRLPRLDTHLERVQRSSVCLPALLPCCPSRYCCRVPRCCRRVQASSQKANPLILLVMPRHGRLIVEALAPVKARDARCVRGPHTFGRTPILSSEDSPLYILNPKQPDQTAAWSLQPTYSPNLQGFTGPMLP